MSALPSALHEHLAAAVDERHGAWLAVDGDGTITRAGGDLTFHGLEDAEPGLSLLEVAPFCGGLTGTGEALVLPVVARDDSRFVEVHVVPDPGGKQGGAWVLLLDATGSVRLHRALQQKANELELRLSARPSPPSHALAHAVALLDAAVWRRKDDGSFVLEGVPPPWLARNLGRATTRGIVPDAYEKAPFLEHFLGEAAALWSSGAAGSLRSGPWTEAMGDGDEWPLEAIALRLDDGTGVLMVQHQGESDRERRGILQGARATHLDLESLQREIQKKEFLLSCLVHDLNGPLASIVGSLSVLRRPGLAAADADALLATGLRQAQRQVDMLHAVLEVFRGDIETMQAFETTAERAPDARAALADAAAGAVPTAAARNVRVTVDAPGEGRVPVVGRADHLGRVLGNLIDNALRHSPAGGTLTLGLRVDDGRVRLTVDDEGPGVPPEQQSKLFERFAQGTDAPGLVGLGLDYCRRTVRRWSGSLGYEPRAPRGSRFWVELPRATA